MVKGGAEGHLTTLLVKKGQSESSVGSRNKMLSRTYSELEDLEVKRRLFFGIKYVPDFLFSSVALKRV